MPKTLSRKFIFRTFAAIWAIIFLLLSIFSYQLSVDFWFIPSLFYLGFLALGIIFLIVYTIISIKKKSLDGFYVYILPILLICIFGFFAASYSYDIFVYFKMPIYEEIIQKVSIGEFDKNGSYKGVGFYVEKTVDNNTRVAFPDGTGVIDNWCGLVWDSSGLIGTVSKESNELFGGDLIGIRHKKGPWYIACFT